MLMRKPCYLADAYEKARIGDGRDTTFNAQTCQEIFTSVTKGLQDTPFGARVRAAYGGASDSEIQRKLDRKSPSDVGKWLKRGVWPPTEVLLEIARQTKTNLQWLVFGEGEADLDPLRFLDEKVRRLVERLAAADKTTVEKVIEVLITDGLVRRGSYLFALYPKLRGRELDELRLLFELIQEGAEESESQNARDRTG